MGRSRSSTRSNCSIAPTVVREALGYDAAAVTAAVSAAPSVLRSNARRLAIASLAAAVLVSCTGAGGGDGGGGGDREPARDDTGSPPVEVDGSTFSGNGVTFVYPKGWHEATVTDASVSAGRELWAETVGVDDVNFVWVAGYQIDQAITGDNIEQQARPVARDFGSLFAQAGGELTEGPDIISLGGLPAMRMVGTALTPAGVTIESRVVLGFDGTNEYFVNCQYDEAGAIEMSEGCDTILSTFDVSA